MKGTRTLGPGRRYALAAKSFIVPVAGSGKVAATPPPLLCTARMPRPITNKGNDNLKGPASSNI